MAYLLSHRFSKIKVFKKNYTLYLTKSTREEIIRVHPSFQAYSYLYFLKTYNSAFITDDIQTYSCAFLHNYETCPNDALFDDKYKKFIDKCPLFLRGDLAKLRNFINERICEGDNCKVIDIIENSHVSITNLLTSKTIDIMKNTQYITLIDEQEIVYEKAIEMAKQSMKDNKKRVFIIKGGPGTGKSILAMKILTDVFMNPNNKINKASFVTPIQAQRDVYKYTIRKDNIYKPIIKIIKSSGAFIQSINDENDVLIVDESHRLKEKSGMFENIGENQIKEIIKASKLSIFFIDDLQRVTLKDKGSISEIIKRAKEQEAIIEEFELTSQFRCSGSAGYVSWIEDVLQIRDTANHDVIDYNLHYDIKIVDNPNEMRDFIRRKNKKNNASRIVAGYCWDSKKESRDNSKIYDIEIPKYDFYMSWNLINEQWAIAKDSVERAGCIYTCQGLDFDYVGVIIGQDLIYRNGKVEVDYTKRAKTDRALNGIRRIIQRNRLEGEKLVEEIIKNTYRVLLTRGKCRMYCIL